MESFNVPYLLEFGKALPGYREKLLNLYISLLEAENVISKVNTAYLDLNKFAAQALVRDKSREVEDSKEKGRQQDFGASTTKTFSIPSIQDSKKLPLVAAIEPVSSNQVDNRKFSKKNKDNSSKKDHASNLNVIEGKKIKRTEKCLSHESLLVNNDSDNRNNKLDEKRSRAESFPHLAVKSIERLNCKNENQKIEKKEKPECNDGNAVTLLHENKSENVTSNKVGVKMASDEIIEYWVDSIPIAKRKEVKPFIPPVMNIYYTKNQLNRKDWREIELCNINKLLESQANLKFFFHDISKRNLQIFLEDGKIHIYERFYNELTVNARNSFSQYLVLREHQKANNNKYQEKKTLKKKCDILGICKIGTVDSKFQKWTSRGLLEVSATILSLSKPAEVRRNWTQSMKMPQPINIKEAKSIVLYFQESLLKRQSTPVAPDYYPWCGIPPLLDDDLPSEEWDKSEIYEDSSPSQTTSAQSNTNDSLFQNNNLFFEQGSAIWDPTKEFIPTSVVQSFIQQEEVNTVQQQAVSTMLQQSINSLPLQTVTTLPHEIVDALPPQTGNALSQLTVNTVPMQIITPLTLEKEKAASTQIDANFLQQTEDISTPDALNTLSQKAIDNFLHQPINFLPRQQLSTSIHQPMSNFTKKPDVLCEGYHRGLWYPNLTSDLTNDCGIDTSRNIDLEYEAFGIEKD